MYSKVITHENIKFALGMDGRIFIERVSGVKAGLVKPSSKRETNVVEVKDLKLTVAQEKVVAAGIKKMTGRNYMFEDSKGFYYYEDGKKKHLKGDN